MASELSESVWNKWTVTGDLRELIDAELQEAREVLEGLRFKGGCWSRDCIPPLEHHRPICERARALWAKLEIKQ